MDDWQNKIDNVFKELKDFQNETVDFAYEKLKVNGRYLVADEVGLGKTKIAKGIIAKAMQEYINQQRKTPYRIFYVCSNQALASQNLKDLNIFKNERFANPELNRLIFLAKNRDNAQKFILSSLTPSTSFKITYGTGHRDERRLIYTVLTKNIEFGNKDIQRGLKWLLIGDVTNWKDWEDKVISYQKEFWDNIIKGIPEKYIEKLKEKPIGNEFKECIAEVTDNEKKPKNLFELVMLYCEKLSNKNDISIVKSEYRARNRTIIYLRKLLIEVSLENLQADLFILDEFQRFKELVGMGQKDSETSLLAKKVFSIPGAKCLMLSATPFKLYTTQFDELQNENHYTDLIDLLKFLFYDQETPIAQFEALRKIFFKNLKNIHLHYSEPDSIKQQIEELYKQVLCRTEKIIVSKDKNSLYDSIDTPDLETQSVDLENFIQTDRSFQKLINEHGQKINYSIDYNKSVAYPLSFMEGYKSKKKFNEFLERKPREGQSLLKDYKKAWIDLNLIQRYKFSKYPNGKLRRLLAESVEKDELWKLLWLPPSQPYYPGMGVFSEKKNLSKILIFSRWVMVPKMIAGLVSYEVERLSIGDKKYFSEINAKYSVLSRNKIAEEEFTKEGQSKERRKPLPILRLQLKRKEASSLRSFTLLYPSKTLVDLACISKNISNQRSYKELREELIVNVTELLKPIKERISVDSLMDKNWYWAAPVILDRLYNYEIYKIWFKNILRHPITLRELKKDIKQNKSVIEHLQVLTEVFDNTASLLPLGAMPNDLEKVLVDIALGSPANCVLKCFEMHFLDKIPYHELLDSALGLSYDFLLLFDKPESIAAVQINEADKDKRFNENKDTKEIYWNFVLRYCIDGNFQAIMDEYCHMLISKCHSLSELANAISSGINIRTSNVKIEGLKNSNSNELETKLLRCHYAVSFGNQNMEEESGRARANDVISNFNSPFRPFVLASTSLGQEGLDFHYYCRKIMHWNLPYNPVELEQREGRINRFKGLVIRQNIASKYKSELSDFKDVWEELFQIAEEIECKREGNPEIVPYWHTETHEGIKIERMVPLLPFSKDASRYQELITVLAMYRLTFGQPRQEELIKAFKNAGINSDNLSTFYDRYIINLSPIKFKPK